MKRGKGKAATRPDSTVAALVSGGVESLALLDLISRRYARVIPVYVRCGLRWEGVERYWLRKLLAALRRPGLQPLAELELPVADLYPEGHWSRDGRRVPGYDSDDREMLLPGRNILLLAKTAVLAAQRGASAVAFGPLASNPFPDGNGRFFKRMEAALSTGLGRPLRVLTPVAGMHKDEVIRSCARLPLELTFSCIRPVGRMHCSHCNKCAERRKAFAAARVPDATRYAG